MANLSPTRECQSSRLEELTAQATSRYSTKDYDAAAEFYAHATELQAEINGEMSTKNADLLYAYGRCLYQVAIKNSDVLGSGVAEGKPTGSYAKSLDKKPLPMAGDIRKNERDLAEEQITKLAEESEGEAKTQDSAEELSKPYFQFTGDENFDTSEYDADEGDAEGEEEGPEEEDDFANAYEVLDLARVLFQQRIHEVEHSSDRGKITTEPLARKLQGLLADTYDLQAEISLEGERFPDAAADLKAALELKMTLYPDESSIIAEAHYKLALALEFSSMMQHKGEMDNNREGLVNYRLREEAAMQMEAAIASCRVRIQKEQEKLRISLQINHDGTECETLAKDIKDVDGLVNEMEQRVNQHCVAHLCLRLTM